jgi:uncharacterized membrane protein YhaH (DUF805 family)
MFTHSTVTSVKNLLIVSGHATNISMTSTHSTVNNVKDSSVASKHGINILMLFIYVTVLCVKKPSATSRSGIFILLLFMATLLHMSYKLQMIGGVIQMIVEILQITMAAGALYYKDELF